MFVCVPKEHFDRRGSSNGSFRPADAMENQRDRCPQACCAGTWRVGCVKLAQAAFGITEVKGRLGSSVAVISIDADRVDYVRLAFEMAATGAHTITTLTEILEELGLRTRDSYKRPSKPLSRSMVHRMLRDDYYIGIVTLKGVKRPGRHDPIIDRATFERGPAGALRAPRQRRPLPQAQPPPDRLAALRHLPQTLRIQPHTRQRRGL